MDANRFKRIRSLFDDIVAMAPDQRESALREAVGDDADLRVEVERLLMASERGASFFDKPSTVEVSAVSDRWEGRKLGPYELLSQLGEGGMGVVYLARRADGAFQKQVAIKIVRQNLATRDFLARFQREREILARLEHPHIARLLDGGSTPSGLAYLVMEYVQGEPLMAYADARRLPFDNRLRLLRQVADAVDYAHKQGVVHRDLKPSNIFVGLDGQVKLLDFGIAAWQQQSPEANYDDSTAPTIALSPAYASPEQARGERTTKATDIYSFAMVAYELLAGVLPFPVKGVTLQDVLTMISERIPRLPSVAVEKSTDPVPAELGLRRRMAPVDLIDRLTNGPDQALFQALSKRKEDRPVSANELFRQLEVELNPSESAWRKSVVTEARQWAPILLACAALGVLVFLGEITVRPFAWVVFAVGLALLVAKQTGLGRSVFQYQLLWLGGIMVTLSLAWQTTRTGTADSTKFPSWAFLTIFGLWAGGRLLLYCGRRRLLGERLVSSMNRKDKWKLALCALGLGALPLWIAAHPTMDLPVIFVILLARGMALVPFEVGRKGLAAAGQIIYWRDVDSYSWISETELELGLRKPTFWTSEAVLKARVKHDDIERIQAELQKWVLEKPSPNRPLALGEAPEFNSGIM